MRRNASDAIGKKQSVRHNESDTMRQTQRVRPNALVPRCQMHDVRFKATDARLKTKCVRC